MAAQSLHHLVIAGLEQGLGGHGEFVEKPEDLKPAIERAFASGKPALVNVAIQGAISPRAEAAIARRRAAMG